jgi:hypothetical protein
MLAQVAKAGPVLAVELEEEMAKTEEEFPASVDGTSKQFGLFLSVGFESLWHDAIPTAKHENYNDGVPPSELEHIECADCGVVCSASDCPGIDVGTLREYRLS